MQCGSGSSGTGMAHPPIHLTANSKSVVPKVAKQLTELGVPAGCVVAHVGKCRVTLVGCAVADVISALFVVNHVERVLLEVNSCTPDQARAMLSDLNRASTFAEAARWAPVLSAFSVINHRAPLSWTLDSRLRVPTTAGDAAPPSKIDLQNATRQGLHLALGKLGLTHNTATPDMLVFLSVTGSSCTLSVPILGRRIVEKLVHKGLHHTVAWGMGRTAKLVPGEVVVDVCVGKAAVLLESASTWPECQYLGCDIDPDQLRCAAENVAAHSRKVVELVRGDSARGVPVRGGIVDCAVSDLPFGRAMSTAAENRMFYPRICAELRRILRPGVGRAVLLTGEESDDILQAALEDSGLHTVRRAAFPFGGNKDRMMCALFMVTAAATDADRALAEGLFDWRFTEKLDENGRHNWRNEKPCMVLYRPKAHVAKPATAHPPKDAGVDPSTPPGDVQ